MEDIKLILKDKGKAEEARELLKGFHLTAEDARKITETFEREMELGMEGGLSASSLQVLSCNYKLDGPSLVIETLAMRSNFHCTKKPKWVKMLPSLSGAL